MKPNYTPDRISDYTPKEGYGLIYRYVFDDGKMYIGQTKNSLQKRHFMHLRSRRSHLERTLKELKGTGRFYMEPLIELPRSELNEAETYYIGKFGTFYPGGYNKTTTGQIEFYDISKRAPHRHGKHKHRVEKSTMEMSYDGSAYIPPKLINTFNYNGCTYDAYALVEVMLPNCSDWDKNEIVCRVRSGWDIDKAVSEPIDLPKWESK